MRSDVLVVAIIVLSACNPAKLTLLRARTIEAGPECPAGGVTIESGRDQNGDGALNDDEVNGAETSYACSGGAGDAGVNGLTLAAVEPPGASCPGGGVRIDTGLDLDVNGALSAGEVRSTQYVCNAPTVRVFYGDLTVRTQADLEALSGIEVVTGTLRFAAAPTSELVFPTLRVVGGAIFATVESSGEVREQDLGASSLSFPALTHAGSIVLGGTLELTTFSAPALARVGVLSISGNGALETLALDSLASASDVEVAYNSSLVALSLPRLVEVNSLRVEGNEQLSSLTAPTLTMVLDSLSVAANAALPQCVGYQLASRLGTRPLNGIQVSDNDLGPVCTAAAVCDPRTITGLGTLRSCAWPLDFTEARAACQSLGDGAHLAWVTSDVEWDALKASVSASLGTAWLGYSDEDVEGEWRALSGFADYTPTARTDFWASGPGTNPNLDAAMLTNGPVRPAATSGTLANGFVCRGP
jgi:hypothetical protein